MILTDERKFVKVISNDREPLYSNERKQIFLNSSFLPIVNFVRVNGCIETFPVYVFLTLVSVFYGLRHTHSYISMTVKLFSFEQFRLNSTSSLFFMPQWNFFSVTDERSSRRRQNSLLQIQSCSVNKLHQHCSSQKILSARCVEVFNFTTMSDALNKPTISQQWVLSCRCEKLLVSVSISQLVQSPVDI